MGRPCPDVPRVDWVVAGGESGPGARPCDIDWLRSIVGQCAEAGVAFHLKQIGAKPYEQRPTPTGEGFDPSDILAGGLDRDVHRRWWSKEGWTLVKTPTGSSMLRYTKITDSKGAVISDWPPDLQRDSRQLPEVSR